MRVVQLYEVVRTAHLERATELDDVTLLYRGKRYDFDDVAASKVRVLRAGLLSSAWYAIAHPVDVIEINEPMVVFASVRSLTFVTLARARARVTGSPRPRAVSYAIANVATTELRKYLPWRARLKDIAQRPIASWVWRSLDRVAFGTQDALKLYGEEFSDLGAPTQKLIEAIPAPAELSVGDDSPEARPPTIVFLGDMSERKGFPDVVAAWSEVRESLTDARLTIIGRGAGAAIARSLAERDDRVEAIVDPPRDEIFRHLQSAKVLVLPSRRRPLWKEQIGLPILEGLSHGCIIVTTSETGIAAWLSDHGHLVVPEVEVSSQLAPAMIAAATSPVTATEVMSQLPTVDGREAARDWLFSNQEGSSRMAKSERQPNILARVLTGRRLIPAYVRGVLAGHPGVRIGRDVKLTGPGLYRLDRGAVITAGVRIWVGTGGIFTMKQGSKIGNRSIINVESAVTLEAGTQVSWDVQILDTDFHWIENESGVRRAHTAAIVLGPRALIGARSMVLKGVTVAAGAIVGAGSVVRRSVPGGAVVAGNPAQQVTTVSDWGSIAD